MKMFFMAGLIIGIVLGMVVFIITKKDRTNAEYRLDFFNYYDCISFRKKHK